MASTVSAATKDCQGSHRDGARLVINDLPVYSPGQCWPDGSHRWVRHRWFNRSRLEHHHNNAALRLLIANVLGDSTIEVFYTERGTFRS